MDPLKKEAEAGDEGEPKLGRRAALKKLGLFGLAAYAAPSMMNLSDAEAASRSRSRSNDRRKKRRKNRKKKNRKNRSRSVSRSRSRSRSRSNG